MKVLLLNQCFYPDVVSTAQHLTDLAVELAGQGHAVTVIASRRGYDNAAVRFKSRETWKGIDIIRIPSLGLGKDRRWRRAVNFGSFMAFCALRLLFTGRFDTVVALTSPPLISFLAAAFSELRGGRLLLWTMDLNPDEAIAAGWLREGSLVARVLSAFLRFSFRRAGAIVVLDRFMERRLLRAGVPQDKLFVVPPWSHDEAARYDHAGRLAFREALGLTHKFVVMYSGNHSPCHPLDTLLAAASRLGDHPEFHFCFVGGGAEFNKVIAFSEDRGLRNITCLPYQPLNKLAASLSAADLHVVVMGEPFVGIVHPCKIYNILSVGAPFLYIGPRESHITDIAAELDGAAHVADPGHVEAVVKVILKSRRCRDRLANSQIARRYSRAVLLPKIVGMIEGKPHHAPARAATAPQIQPTGE
ncbi:MAG TPA: glycosyltransferase family 4 protein [Blastocatellia bacterium]|nr:glycosyltransferase family 4 protein [Blastocatellia bacterium]